MRTRTKLHKVLAGTAMATTMALMIGAGSAQSTVLVGAETIHITSAYSGGDSYTQIAELKAFDIHGVDMALASNGATASAPNTWQDFNGGVSTAAANAIDGSTDGNYLDGAIFHSGTAGASGYLDVTLATPTDLSRLSIFGRTDCCTWRDIYSVTIYNSSNDLLYSGTLDATGPSNSALVSFVPEPTIWAMFLVGFGALGFMMRGSRRKDAAVMA